MDPPTVSAERASWRNRFIPVSYVIKMFNKELESDEEENVLILFGHESNDNSCKVPNLNTFPQQWNQVRHSKVT